MKKTTENIFIEKANIIHNNKYDYSLIEYKNALTKIKIICPTHGVFEQRPNNHINRKHGCPNCSINRKITQKEFINKANKIHNDKYDYSLVEYVNAKSKIKIICPIHGVFEQIASSHTDQKTGCSICSKKHNYSDFEFINKANIIHNDKYDYSLVEYKNNYTKIKIICPIHGEFKQTPTNHLNGKGCLLCGESKGENKIRLFLNKNNIKFIPQHKFPHCKYKKKLPFDFYLPEHNMCIEYNGLQHYKPISWFGGEDGFIKQQIRDKIKMEYCQNNNIPLIIVKYNDDIVNKLSLYFNI